MPEQMPDILTGFDCIADEHSEILILGSMPGVASLQKQEYYAHPRNAFWKIIQALYGIPHDVEYDARLSLLKENKIALWDVVHQCVRAGSLDSNIKPDTVQVNDFKELFGFSQNLKTVCFNGGKAADLYKRKVMKGLVNSIRSVNYLHLPSTSPANARMTIDQKIEAWKQVAL